MRTVLACGSGRKDPPRPLRANSIAALTVYDMCKAVERGIRIEEIRLARKSGGKSGGKSGEFVLE